ncbi:hypothetical protein BJY00DRAFT_295821 [Aspergillus carlsbadensis]|nr:hypothetical protein BJY00DRAFT_295821 [Aspergillus carlsbadensis]
MSSESVRAPKADANKLVGRTIDVIAGAERTVYSVHEALVFTSSPFFEKAMAGEWKESSQRTIQLPDDEPSTVALYVHWLYYRTLPVFCDEPGLPGNAEYLDLVKAYVFGDKILDTTFQNAIIDAMIEKSGSKARDGASWYPVGEVLEYAYNNIAEPAPILELLVDMYVTTARRSWLYDWANPATIPQPFLLSLSSKLLHRRVASDERLEASKYYTDASDHDSAPPAEG